MTKVILYTDGGSRGNPGNAGAGALITDEAGNVLREAKQSLGTMTNNEAEYQAVILGLETAKKLLGKDKLQTTTIEHRLDSELVCKQLNGEYQVKEEHLGALWMKVWNLKVADIPHVTHAYIPREQNSAADKLANLAMDEGTTTQEQLL